LLIRAFYRGNRERVTSVNEAVGSLGFESIKNIVLNSSVFKIFDNGIESQDFDLSDLWQHSMGVGWASRNIARILGQDLGRRSIQLWSITRHRKGCSL
jgi:HD-like signal output (HDOD) protein